MTLYLNHRLICFSYVSLRKILKAIFWCIDDQMKCIILSEGIFYGVCIEKIVYLLNVLTCLPNFAVFVPISFWVSEMMNA